MTSVAALSTKVATLTTRFDAFATDFNGFKAGLSTTIENALKDALSGQTTSLQTAVTNAVSELKTECLGFIQNFGEELQVVKRDISKYQVELDQVKLVADEASKQAQNAVVAANKRAASVGQPHPTMIREIKERIMNESSLVLSPVSDSILEQNLTGHVVHTFNTHTNLSLTPADVVSVKRLGRAGSQFKGVRVTFANVNVRNKVFNERRKFGKPQGDHSAVFLNPDLTRSQQEHKRRMMPLFKHIRDANRQAGIQGKAPFFDEEFLYHYPPARMGYPVLHPANFDEQAMAAAMPAAPSTSAAAQA